MELHAAPVPGGEIPRVQLRRRRAGHVQGPRHPALQPAHRHRGHGDRGVRHGNRRRIQLHPRRDLGDLRALRGSPGRGAPGRLHRHEHPRQRFLLRALRPPRLWRVHLRGGNRAARVARGQEGPAALQAALSGELRPVRQADHDQQHRDLRGGALDRQPRGGCVSRSGQGEQRRHQDLFGDRPRREAGQLRSEARHAVREAARDGGRHARRKTPESGHPRRIFDARAAGGRHDAHRHGLRFDREGRLDARFGCRDRHG